MNWESLFGVSVLWRCESREHPVYGKQNKVGGNIMIRQLSKKTRGGQMK